MNAGDTVNLLLVEDDAKVALSLRQGLQENSFAVVLARSAGEAEERIAQHAFQVMVLDLGLPDRDGIELLKELRRSGQRMPVLILSARDAVDERVLGLEAGADDYLAKPFAYSELLARLRALSRRTETRAGNVLRVLDLEMDLLDRSARRKENVLNLTPREFDVLAYLAHQPGMIVSRDTLMREVWKIHSRASSMDNVIDVLMARLREKVDKGRDIHLLLTVRGVGYKLRTAP